MGKNVESFLEQYKNSSTISCYKAALNKFFEAIGKKDGDYFTKKQDYEQDVKTFFNHMADSPPKTTRVYLAAVKMFLSDNEVDLPDKFWRGLRRKIKGSRARTLDMVPDSQELKEILTHTDAKGKALFLMLASSGMRIDEALNITLHDVELDQEPAKISIRGEITKTGNSRIAFMSHEAKEAVMEWLKERETYIRNAAKRSRYGKKNDDDRLFPFTYPNAREIWNNAIHKAGFAERDNGTNRYKVHIHVLRKFFRTQMATKIPRDIAEALMGHEGYLTEVYRRYSPKQLAEFYIRGENTVTVFQDQNGVKRLRKEMTSKMGAYDELIERQAAKIKELERELGSVKKSKNMQVAEALREALHDPEVADIIVGTLEEVVKKREKRE